MSLPPHRVDYSPIIDRPRLIWPNQARVALWVAPNVEHYEYLPEYEGHRNPWPRKTYPDAREYSYRDYGNRVGFWRMLEVLDAYGIKCCVSLNLAVLEHYPEIAAAMIERDWDFMSHGIYNTRYLYGYSEDREREFYRDNIETLKRHTGKTLKGMLGPAISGTANTPDLMAEAGLIYHTDWLHDDQPVPIRVNTGRLISVPYSIELNDSPCSAPILRARILCRSARTNSINSTARGQIAGESCASPYTRLSFGSRTAFTTWMSSSAISCRTTGYGRRRRTRLPNTTWPTTMIKPWRMQLRCPSHRMARVTTSQTHRGRHRHAG